MAKTYYPRVIDDILAEYLDVFGAILISGPKWCGKTTSAMHKAKSVLKMQDPDKSTSYLQAADVMPSLLLKGESPRLIDEWQMAPKLWDAVRIAVDDREEAGQFILTGSSIVDESKIMHTGTGRITRVDMHTMSLFESKESNGTVGLLSLFNGDHFEGAASNLSVEDLAFSICRGGWPASVTKNNMGALLISNSYVDAICNSDISKVDGISKKPERVHALIRSYARNISTLATNKTILADINANDSMMQESTMYTYLSALKRLYVIEDIPAWNPSIRSTSAIRSSDKKGFSDPSIATAALMLSPQQLLEDLSTFGFFFESLCMRDLKIYSTKLKGKISYYHDRYGLECDAVLHLNSGQYALIEMKLGSLEIELGASHLLELKKVIEKNKMREPAFLMVLTGGQYAYLRKDGIYVVPIGCLRD